MNSIKHIPIGTIVNVINSPRICWQISDAYLAFSDEPPLYWVRNLDTQLLDGTFKHSQLKKDEIGQLLYG